MFFWEYRERIWASGVVDWRCLAFRFYSLDFGCGGNNEIRRMTA